MRKIFFFTFLLPIVSASQSMRAGGKETDPDKMEINKNIFRIKMSLSTDTKLSLTGSYEREIKRPLTIFFNAGPAFDQNYDSTDAFGTKHYRLFINAIASAEIRCYINLKRRMKLQKTTRNFSAWYISLEELLKSRALIVFNNRLNEPISGSNGLYINIGVQRQHKKTYSGAFFGTRFPGKIYENSADVFDIIHAGITIGRVF